MAEEKIFIINLRREFSKKPLYRRAKKAVTAVKEFISKHLKVEEVKIGKHLNKKIWERGKRKPLPKVKVKAIVENNVAYVELPEFEFDRAKPKEEKKGEKHEHKHHEHSAKEEQAKEQEKVAVKELSHEEEIKQKKEHRQEIIEKPGKSIKPQEKVVEDIQKHGRVIGSTGKK